MAYAQNARANVRNLYAPSCLEGDVNCRCQFWITSDGDRAIMSVMELASGYGLENAQSASLDAGLFRCMDDKEICRLGCCCPCVLMGRTAEFVGEDCCVCGAAWLCCEIPCCIGGLLRSRLSHQLGQVDAFGMFDRAMRLKLAVSSGSTDRNVEGVFALSLPLDALRHLPRGSYAPPHRHHTSCPHFIFP